MFGLIDANSFFASCEQVFRPDLLGKPVVVLSNNDGCIIARSKEAKQLDIPMGKPVYQVQSILDRNGVAVFSSNFPLYADFSSRLVALYQSLFSEVQVYSIDEAFVRLSMSLSRADLFQLGTRVHTLAKQWTGIPVSVGFGVTKTLAKMANHLAKTQGKAVFIMPENPTAIFETFPVKSIWGVGWRSAQYLQGHGVYTAAQFLSASPSWLQKHLSVHAVRIQLELQGVSCGEMGPAAPQKNILSSRSFGKKLSDLHALKGALTQNLITAVDKLVASDLVAGSMMVFFSTGRHDENRMRVVYPVSLVQPTAALFELLQGMLIVLPSAFKQGYRYARAGVLLSDLLPNTMVQQSLFSRHHSPDQEKLSKLSPVLAEISQKWGKSMVVPAVAIQGKSLWKPAQNHRSPRYTTVWAELLQVQ